MTVLEQRRVSGEIEMRILTVIHLYPPHHVGGYEVACRGVMERFHERGHDVLVLTSAVQLPDTGEAPSNNSVEVRRELRLWFDMDAFVPLSPPFGTRVTIERNNQSALKRAVRDFRPDVASIWNMGFSSWALMRMLEIQQVPLVFTLLDDWPIYAYTFDAWTRIFDHHRWARPIGSALGLCTRLPTFEGAAASVASQMIAERVALYGRWKFPVLPIIQPGVDTREIPIQVPLRRPWSWRLVYVGRVVKDKGVPTLIRALAGLPGVTRLDIVGHGSDSEIAEMRTLAQSVEAGDRVHFSRVSRLDLSKKIREADILIFPSEWEEPFGIVPLEAMACGVPVVATGTGGSGEYLVDGGNCVLFSAGDPTALSSAIRRIADDAELRQRVVNGGTATAKRLNMDRYADSVEDHHLRALEAARTAG